MKSETMPKKEKILPVTAWHDTFNYTADRSFHFYHVPGK